MLCFRSTTALTAPPHCWYADHGAILHNTMLLDGALQCSRIWTREDCEAAAARCPLFPLQDHVRTRRLPCDRTGHGPLQMNSRYTASVAALQWVHMDNGSSPSSGLRIRLDDNIAVAGFSES